MYFCSQEELFDSNCTQIAEIRNVAKSLPPLRWNRYKSLILSCSADFSVFFKERVCYIYNHRFRYLTLYIQTTHTLHLFTERGTTDYTDWHRGAQRKILRYVLSDGYSRKQKDDTHGHTQKWYAQKLQKSVPIRVIHSAQTSLFY